MRTYTTLLLILVLVSCHPKKKQKEALLIRPAIKPRQGWEETFANAPLNLKEDSDLTEPLVGNQFDDEEWTW